MEAQVLPAGKAETSELFLVPESFRPELHEGLELDQRLLDLGHCPYSGVRSEKPKLQRNPGSRASKNDP